MLPSSHTSELREPVSPQTHASDPGTHGHHPAPSQANPQDAAAFHTEMQSRPNEAKPGRFQQAMAYGAPATDAAAAGLSIAASRLTGNPLAEKIVGGLSGGLWGAGGAMSEGDNKPHDTTTSVANGLGIAAGGLSAAASLASQGAGQSAAASAAAWGANGLLDMGRAALSKAGGPAHRIMTGVSGASNLAAAGLAGKAAHASANNDSTTAANYALASSVTWGIGSAAKFGAAWAKMPAEHRHDAAGQTPSGGDLEAQMPHAHHELSSLAHTPSGQAHHASPASPEETPFTTAPSTPVAAHHGGVNAEDLASRLAALANERPGRG